MDHPGYSSGHHPARDRSRRTSCRARASTSSTRATSTATTWCWRAVAVGQPLVAGATSLQQGPYAGMKPDVDVIKLQADIAFWSRNEFRFLVIGVDFGTDWFRPRGGRSGRRRRRHLRRPYRRWAEGLYCDPVTNGFGIPLDYLESMEAAIVGALARRGQRRRRTGRRIAVDTTGSTPVLADGEGTRSHSCRVPGRARRDVHPLEGPHVGQPGRANQRPCARLHRWTSRSTSGAFTRRSGSGPRRGASWRPIRRVAEAAVTVSSTATGSRRCSPVRAIWPDPAQPLRRRAQGDVARRVRRLPV